MLKYRIHEVAKDFESPSKIVLELLAKQYPDKKYNHMTTLDISELNLIFEYFTQKFSVESFENFFKSSVKEKKVEKPVEHTAPKKEADVRELQPSGQTEPKEGQKPAPNKEPISKKVRVVDTRAGNVDIGKFDERIETLVPEQAKKAMEKNNKKQKFNNNRQRRTNHNRQMEDEHQKRVAAMNAKKQHIHLQLPESIAVSDLAQRLKVTGAEVVKRLMKLGVMASLSQSIDYDAAALIADELGATVEPEVVVSIEERLFDEREDKEEELVARSPVVVVMGHVDHGKTSLLDAIRHSDVASGEAGGITQHIGAYRTKIRDHEITFLDTPGHEAFTAMRARGAQVTDIAILVVAADDGIMPQTIEAINHAKAANVSIIVAINKMDKAGANPDRIKQELTEYELVPEEWGGDTICVPVSAIKKQGIDSLLEMILLVAEMRDLKANPNRKAKGTVIESKLDKGRGPIATVLVQSGTLKTGDVIIAGTAVGRVRAMVDDKGKKVPSAGPSVPVEIIGLSEVPDGGDLFYAVEDEKMARELVEQRKQQAKEELYKNTTKVSLEDLFNNIKTGSVKELKIIVKADVQGSVEAVKQSLEKLSNEEVKVICIHGGVGAIRESDLLLASASGAIIVGFNVRPDHAIMTSASEKGVDIRTYRIIYDAIDEIGSAMKGLLAPKFKEVILGHAQIRQIFKASGIGTIAGCYMQDGKITRNAKVRILRDGVIVHEGDIASLKRFKDDVKEVAEGFECGISLERFNDIKENDIIEGFVIEEIKQ